MTLCYDGTYDNQFGAVLLPLIEIRRVNVIRHQVPEIPLTLLIALMPVDHFYRAK